MTDEELLATCIADEAGNQIYEGMVAVAVIIRHRMAMFYESDGTIPGTVLKHFQFSGFWFSMRAGHYEQTEWDRAGAAQQAQRLFEKFSTTLLWHKCMLAATIDSLPSAAFHGGPQFQRVKHDPRALLYLNPSIVDAPDWATPDKKIAQIGDHVFYRG